MRRNLRQTCPAIGIRLPRVKVNNKSGQIQVELNKLWDHSVRDNMSPYLDDSNNVIVLTPGVVVDVCNGGPELGR